jgi:hypothetical protein
MVAPTINTRPAVSFTSEDPHKSLTPILEYIMPNDEKEKERLDIHHHISLLHLDGELHLAPIGERPDRILDLGTGTGFWAIDMGTYPSEDFRYRCFVWTHLF